MMKDKIIMIASIAGLLGWIPLGILAFYVSDVRLDVKLTIAAGASFLGMLIWFFKNEG